MVNYQLLEKTYRGKKIFLTGHTGFKGAWLLKTLNLLGAEVKGYALEPNTPNDLFYLIDGQSICNSVIADIRDKKHLEEEILSFQPDFVFHLAAQAIVSTSYKDPVETFSTNVIGTMNILEVLKDYKKSTVDRAVKQLKNRKILQVSKEGKTVYYSIANTEQQSLIETESQF